MDLDADNNKTNININVLSRVKCNCNDNCICPFFKKKEKCLYCSNIEDDNKTPESSEQSKEERNQE